MSVGDEAASNRGTGVAVPDDMPDRWAMLGRLWSQATGGGDSAAVPGGGDDFWKTAPGPPGVDEAAAWFRWAIHLPSSQCMLFLVGGPGAGKSHVSGRVVRGLEPVVEQASGLAHRRYRYRTKHSELLLVNDATIGSDEQHPRPLMHDVESCLETGRHLMACVNRGVLVEELRHAGSALRAGKDLDPQALAVLGWLGDAQDPKWETDTAGLEHLEAPSYMRVARLLSDSGPPALLMAVMVDSCSLLEARPECTVTQASNGSLSVTGSEYQVRRFHERLTDPGFTSPATALMAEVIGAITAYPVADGEAEGILNPFEANLESLSDAGVRRGIECIMRASEIRSSRRFSYRSMWATVVRAVIGDVTNRMNPDDLRQWVVEHQPHAADDVARFDEIRVLASLRFSEALFGACTESDFVERPQNPVTSLTSRVDPIYDAIPGRESDPQSSGWATPVMDAFAGQSVAGAPLANLLSTLDESDGLHRGVTSFDLVVDEAFAAALASSSLSSKKGQEIIRWYGNYLTRLYAVCNGIPAFRREISLWTQAWNSVSVLPNALSKTLPTLLLPLRDPSDPTSSKLLPLLDARTNAITGQEVDPKLAVSVTQVDLKSARRGDSLTVTLMEDGRNVGELELDFAMMREALSCEEGRIGITEQSRAALPRLERIRAASLVSSRADQRAYCYVFGNQEEAFSVGAGT